MASLLAECFRLQGRVANLSSHRALQAHRAILAAHGQILQALSSTEARLPRISGVRFSPARQIEMDHASVLWAPRNTFTQACPVIDGLCLDWVFFYTLTNILFAVISRSRRAYAAATLGFLFFIAPFVFVLISFFLVFVEGQLLPILSPLTQSSLQ